MARIAIAGFMHKTNCFVPDTKDFENFANPPDRSGILRGEKFETFAEKGASTAGFRTAARTIMRLPATLDQHDARRLCHEERLRADRRRDYREALGGTTGRRRLSRLAWRYGHRRI